MPLTTNIRLQIEALYTKAQDLNTADDPLNFVRTIAMLTGTGAQQADKLFHDQRSTSGTDSLDLAAGLIDTFGQSLTFVELKLIAVFAAAANGNNVLLRRPAANGVPFLTAAGDEIPIQPGGLVLLCNPGTGIAVTAGTGDLIDLVSGGGSVTYDIVIIGTSA